MNKKSVIVLILIVIIWVLIILIAFTVKIKFNKLEDRLDTCQSQRIESLIISEVPFKFIIGDNKQVVYGSLGKPTSIETRYYDDKTISTWFYINEKETGFKHIVHFKDGKVSSVTNNKDIK